MALLIHGLFLSPQQMVHQETEAYNLGYNVINLRLKGHYEKDAQSLETVTAEQWIEQVNEVFSLAKALGDQVSIIGHSTGGLLAVHLALQKSIDIDRIILIAPALRVSQLRKFEAYFLSMLRISTETLQNFFLSRANRPLSGRAAWQVVRLSEMLRVSDPEVLEILSKEILTIIDLENDNMVNSDVNQTLFQEIYSDGAPSGATYTEVPKESGLTHADVNFNARNDFYEKIVKPAILAALSLDFGNRVPNSAIVCPKK